jgi:2-C-methyl-D-erythritol 4-phosphate cytidylyltransferase
MNAIDVNIMTNYAIIVGAGNGTRMEGKCKPFLCIDERPLLLLTLEKFEAAKEVDKVIIVTKEYMIPSVEEILNNPKNNITKVEQIVLGGETRQDSAYNGFKSISKDNNPKIVLVHDAVRPFITPELIDESILEAKKHGGAIVAIPATNTIKQSHLHRGEEFVKQTFDRSTLWEIQTPQTFKYDILKEAYEEAKYDSFIGTDEASIVERCGHDVKLIKGIHENIKITVHKDLAIAKIIMQINSANEKTQKIKLQNRL